MESREIFPLEENSSREIIAPSAVEYTDDRISTTNSENAPDAFQEDVFEKEDSDNDAIYEEIFEADIVPYELKTREILHKKRANIRES